MENSEILDKLYIQRDTLLKQLEATNNAIIGFGGIVPFNSIPVNKYILEPLPAYKLDGYPLKGSYEAKILYILETQGAMAATSIADFIAKQEKFKDENQIKTLYNNITIVSSTMFKNGKILADKDGRKNIYRLKSHK